MRLTTLLTSFAAASLLLATPVLAGDGDKAADGQCSQPHAHGHRGMKGGRHGGMHLARMEHRLDRAVESGRLSQAQADQFKGEMRQLRDETKAQRDAAGGQLTEEQRTQFKERARALREKVKAALKETAPAKQET
ncbi:hypothetical protein LZ198_31915 [Myxococcus sp. K15C18031901]|uniref:hypothetical protein n=1 Tax=Myxococcus dinghuensis TaxID=2906761 RepID=UPI0020A701C2|nr:hypothetical protein [Myxococcus dinghuensis]MCP3103500.1 hypothetical protein [Myxococcus dinghuensis]